MSKPHVRQIVLAFATSTALVTGCAGLAYAGATTAPDRATEQAGFEWRYEDWPSGVPNNNFRHLVRVGDEIYAAPAPGDVGEFTGTIYRASSPSEPWTPVTDGRAADSNTEMWASAPDDLYQTDVDQILHFDGTEWSSDRFPGIAGAIWGSGPRDIYIGGDRIADDMEAGVGRLVRGSEQGWVEERYDDTKRPPVVNTIWGSGQGDVYLGTLTYRDGSPPDGIYHKVDGQWTKELSGYEVEELVGTGPDDVWALAIPEQGPYTSVILRSGGAGNWTEVVRVQGGFTINDIAATGSGELLYTETRGIYRARTDGEVRVLHHAELGCGVIGTWSADEVVSRCPTRTAEGIVPSLLRGSR